MKYIKTRRRRREVSDSRLLSKPVSWADRTKPLPMKATMKVPIAICGFVFGVRNAVSTLRNAGMQHPVWSRVHRPNGGISSLVYTSRNADISWVSVTDSV